MKLIILIPKVIRQFISEFPEVKNNAYKYFNYDNRVVVERADRHDQKSCYKDPDDLTDLDYDSLVSYAQTLINPLLMKYSKTVAYEDALTMAIKDYNKGMFDSKINANRFKVLLAAMDMPVMAKKQQPAKVHKKVLKDLGLSLKDIPHKYMVRKRVDAPTLVKEKGQVIVNR